MQETWKPIVGYEGFYDISDLGRVKRVKRGQRTRPGFILKIHGAYTSRRGVRCKLVTGYPYVGLSHGKKGTTKKKRIHQAVAEAFLGPLPSGNQIHHKDGDVANNRLANLEYVTRHAHFNDKHDALRGVANGNSKLTPADVRIVMSSDESAIKLGKRLGVTQGTVLAIRNGKTWRHVTHL